MKSEDYQMIKTRMSDDEADDIQMIVTKMTDD
jgi:hypothetical protein